MEKFVIYEKDFYQKYSQFERKNIRDCLDGLCPFLDREDLEGALNYLIESPYITMPEFSFYRINLLIRLNRIDEALEIAEDEKFKSFKPIQVQREGIVAYLNQIKEEQKLLEQSECEKVRKKCKKKKKRVEDKVVNQVEKDYYQIAKKLFAKIYVGVITLEEIQTAEIDDYTKIILTTCYYDKFNRAEGVKFLKNIRNMVDDNVKRQLNKIMGKLENKKNTFFDIGSYGQLLHLSVDFDYVEKLQSDLQRQEELEEEKRKEIIRKNEEANQKYREEQKRLKKEKQDRERTYYISNAEVKGANSETSVNEEIDSLSDSRQDIKTTSNTDGIILKSPEVKKDIPKIKDAFPSETNIISMFLYALANAKKSTEYIQQFDNFEILVNKRVDNIWALEKFENVVLKCACSTNVEVEWDRKKFLRLYKKNEGDLND